MRTRDMLMGSTVRKLLAVTLFLTIALSYAELAAASNRSQPFIGATQEGTHVQTSTVWVSSRASSPLTSGLTVTGLLNYSADSNMWYVDVSTGASSMLSVLTCPTYADFDLYGKLGSFPTPTYSDWRGTSPAGEDVLFNNPGFGRWYIMPYSFSGNGSYSLTVTITYGIQFNFPSTVITFMAIGVAAFILIVVRAVRRSRTRGYYETRPTYRQPGIPEGDVSAPEATRTRVPPSPSIKCARCGASLVVGDDYCWNCGAKVKASIARAAKSSGRTETRLRSGICMVCGSSLAKSDEVLSCPYCGGLAHREHLLEWLHVKDYCPSCERHLDEHDISM